jgi:glycosyltransferase involved in cell wall biosynthesis
MLSIIIPTFNEIEHGYLAKILPSINNLPNTEIICVDSGSNDGTLELIKSANVTLHTASSTTRAGRMNAGVDVAKGDTILFYHPRILIQTDGIKTLAEKSDAHWGGFLHQFTANGKLYNFISWYSNNVRFKKKHIVYLDHGIFVETRLAKKVFPIPDEPIFEDTILSLRLKKHAAPTMIEHTALVSPVRFETRGPIRQFLGNQLLKALFSLGVKPITLNNWYEGKLRLNG